MLPDPNWISSLPSADRADALHRVRCRLAALYNGPDHEYKDTGCNAAIRNADKHGAPLVYPAWVRNIVNGQRRRAELHFLVRAAALWASQEGTLTRLSIMCDLNDRALSTYTALDSGRSRISPVVAQKIEKACGGLVTRRQLCPEVFLDD